MDKKELISSMLSFKDNIGMWKIVLNQITDADFVIGYGFDNNEKLWKVYQNNERGMKAEWTFENEEKIREAHLEFRWKLPEDKVVLWLDSEKTYRIFENLIVNITKYAMPHTRVYIEMNERPDDVQIFMKNVSAGELNFNTEEITDRFVRGDSSRNTEGSGLGLAIAKSFAQLQHGNLKITTEADLFKAEIILPKLEMSEKKED